MNNSMQRYNDIIKKYVNPEQIKTEVNIPKIKQAISEDNINHGTCNTGDSHGMPKSTWKSLDKNIRRKLKKYGFSRYTEINPAFIAYITKKVEKKKLKKGVKNTL